jgi:chemotaxis regulatin CheY-phosphate phosphatase CheZ
MATASKARITKTAAVKPAAKKSAAKAPAKKVAARKTSSSSARPVLQELKSLAKVLGKAAESLNKGRKSNPKEVSTILGNVERMTSEAATQSLNEAENAKHIVSRLTDTLSRDWSRKDIEASLKAVGSHLTNIIVAQEFQDLAGQSIRKAMKALVGSIIVTEGGGQTEERRLSQKEIDSLLNDLMP